METARILIVDDNALARDLTSAILVPAGCEIETAANGAEAVDAVRRDRFDLVLLNLNMPMMDGLAASHAIRACEDEGRKLPLLALSVRPEEDEADKRRAMGIDASLAKPFRAVDLLALIHRWARAAPSPENETGLWDQQIYQELAGGIGAKAMSGLLLLFGQHLDQALLVVETSGHAREVITRAHKLVT